MPATAASSSVGGYRESATPSKAARRSPVAVATRNPKRRRPTVGGRARAYPLTAAASRASTSESQYRAAVDPSAAEGRTDGKPIDAQDELLSYEWAGKERLL